MAPRDPSLITRENISPVLHDDFLSIFAHDFVNVCVFCDSTLNNTLHKTIVSSQQSHHQERHPNCTQNSALLSMQVQYTCTFKKLYTATELAADVY